MQAGQVLERLNALNEYAQINGCKRIEKLIGELNSDSASDVYLKAELYRLYECSKLSGTAKEIEAILGQDKAALATRSLEDIHMAFKLNENTKVYGAKPSDQFESSMAEFAKSWIKDFNPARWTYKTKVAAIENDEDGERVEVRELDLALVQIAESLSGML